MKEKDKDIATLLTLSIDAFLVILLFNKSISTLKDKLYTYALLLVHVIFIYGMYHNSTFIIDASHITISLCILIAPILDSFFLKFIHLLLLLTIQFLWLYKGYCILMTSNIEGCGDFFTIIAAIWTIFLSFMLYINHGQNVSFFVS